MCLRDIRVRSLVFRYSWCSLVVMSSSVVHAVLPDELAEALRRSAREHERSLAAEVRLALRAWLERGERFSQFTRGLNIPAASVEGLAQRLALSTVDPGGDPRVSGPEGGGSPSKNPVNPEEFQ